MKQCIERPELESFVHGKITELRAEEIASHVDDCVSCQDTVVALANSEDTFVAGLKRPDEHQPTAAPADVENAFKHGLQRLLTAIQTPPAGNDAGAAIPKEIGPYRLLESLGVGGMGQVFRAEHTKLKRIVALKVLPVHRNTNAAAISRFEREMEAIGGLDHPLIVRASDAGEDHGIHYLVMDYVDGLDLSRLSRRLGQLPVPEACALARQAAIGLQYAHDKGLVHRDVKPSNLMLAKTSVADVTSGVTAGAKTGVKILDLGLALLDEDRIGEGQDMTTMGALMGTLDYMSPEQGIDSHAVDHRTDVYGLGATLFKLLTGRAPYADPRYSTLMKKMTALATKAAPSVGLIRPELDGKLVATVDQMLSRDPDERFASAGDVAEALATFADDADLHGLLERGLAAAEPSKSEAAPSIKTARSLDQGLVESSATVNHAINAKPASSRGWGGWPVALAIGFLGLIFASGIWIVTDHGTIRIDSLSDDAVVRVKKGSEVAAYIEVKQGVGTTQIRSGEYQIEVVGQTDLVIEPKQVEVSRNKASAVRIGRPANPFESKLPGTEDWEKYSSLAFEKAVNSGKPTLIFFTADWDVSGQVLERTVLKHAKVMDYIRQHDIRVLCANVTRPGTLAYENWADGGRETPAIDFIADPKNSLAAQRHSGLISVDELVRWLDFQIKDHTAASRRATTATLAAAPRRTASNRQARYNDLSLGEWLDIAQFERNPKRVKEALDALSAMISGVDEATAKTCAEAIFQAMRQYGREPMYSADDGNRLLCERAIVVLAKSPRAWVISRALREITEGNTNSRRFLLHLFAPSFTESSTKRLRKLHALMTAQADDILDAVVQLSTSKATSTDDREWAIKFLYHCELVGVVSQKDLTASPAVLNDVIQRVVLESEDDLSQAMGAWLLCADKANAKELVQPLSKLLNSPDVGVKFLALRAARRLGSDAVDLLPDLNELLSSLLVRRQDDSRLLPAPWVLPPSDGKQSTSPVFLPVILDCLESFGQQAEPAVPTLLWLYNEQTLGGYSGMGGGGYGGGYGGGGRIQNPNSAAMLRRAVKKISPQLSSHALFTIEGVGTLPTWRFDVFGNGGAHKVGRFPKAEMPLSIRGFKFEIKNTDDTLDVDTDFKLRTFANLAYLVADASRTLGRSFRLDWRVASSRGEDFASATDEALAMVCVHEKVTVQIRRGIEFTGPAIAACRQELAQQLKRWDRKQPVTFDLSDVATAANEALSAREVRATGGMGGMF